MVKSGREHLSGTVGRRICATEYSVWAAEFGDIRFELQQQICDGCGQCVLRFR
jgi:MinD superfamily P-loop ATPase